MEPLVKIIALALGILWSLRATKGNPVGFILACFALYFLFPDIMSIFQNDFRIGDTIYLRVISLAVRYFAIGSAFVGSFLVLQRKHHTT